MPKMKTKKSVIKKVKITKNGKVIRRATGQNHYNSKETGAEGRAKKKEYGANSKAPYTIMNKLGYMHGNKETSLGRKAEQKHNGKMARKTTGKR